MNTHSISFRLVAWFGGLLAGIFLALCALLYFGLQHFLESDISRSQLRRDDQIANSLLVHVRQIGEAKVAAETKDWFEPEINDRFIRITRQDGTVVYASGAPKDGSFDPADVPAFPFSPKSAFSRKVELPNGKTMFISISKYPADNSGYTVEFGALLDPMESMLNHLFLQLALGLPLAIGIVTFGGYLLVRRALAPVEQITRAAERITQHNLSERLPVAQTGDELERLSVSLNRMISRLDDAFQNSKRFVADASHELRTPLTILRAELENLVDDLPAESELGICAASLLEEAVHLSKIVEQLFTLSRLDAGEAQAEWSRFDLAEVARNTAEQMNLLAEDKKISITCDCPQPISVEGDRVRLKQVVVNLLDNAIKYTPENGAVHLQVGRSNGHAVLEVEDNGAGISREALPHVFERFYREDQSRSGDSEGAGLGLSIVEAICTAHGAKIEAISTPKLGSCFRIKLPLAKD